MTTRPHALRSGPLDVTFGDGELRHIRLGGTEVLERIYVAVRDKDWGTVPGRMENLALSAGASSFSLSFDSIHQQREIDFRWHGTIDGDDLGRIRCNMDGQARSTFLTNRIGLCVLHPLRDCAGRPCTVERPNGSTQQDRFPEFVAPHQPFLDVRALTHEVGPGIRARVRFDGEVFETEDQRNWMDVSYKTYSPPLRQPPTVEVQAGSRIRQAVELSLEGEVRELTAPVPEQAAIELTGEPPVRIPALGLGLPSDGSRLSDGSIERLRRLRLSHIRADLHCEQDAARACAEAERLGLRLEAAVRIPCAIRDLERIGRHVKRWLIFDRASGITTADALAAARRLLGEGAVLVGGSDVYFAELNRDRLPGLTVGGACFPAHPQAHASDDETVMSNTAGPREAVLSAKRFLDSVPVFVSPLTLGPRTRPDPRQKTSFCAAWTVAALKHLAEAGAASVTCFEAHGSCGVQDDSGVFPVYEIFEWLTDFRDGEAIPCRTVGGAKVEAMVLAAGARRRILVANLRGEPQSVRLKVGVEQHLALEPYSVACLDWTEG